MPRTWNCRNILLAVSPLTQRRRGAAGSPASDLIGLRH